MSLDLEDLVADWDCPQGEVAARIVCGNDGDTFVQLRVDLGVLQMRVDGRPDGSRYHGLPSVLEYLQHELRAGRDAISGEHWQALDRELTQLNYRRVAIASCAEDALRRNAEDEAVSHLLRVLRDIDVCHAALELLEGEGRPASSHAHLGPTLIFNRARLLSQLRIVLHDFDGAIEAALDGAEALQALTDELAAEPVDEDGPEHIGVVYLNELSRQLRQQYDIELTLRERLELAIDGEDYELAEALHQELRDTEISRATQETLLPDAAPHEQI